MASGVDTEPGPASRARPRSRAAPSSGAKRGSSSESYSDQCSPSLPSPGSPGYCSYSRISTSCSYSGSPSLLSEVVSSTRRAMLQRGQQPSAPHCRARPPAPHDNKLIGQRSARTSRKHARTTASGALCNRVKRQCDALPTATHDKHKSYRQLGLATLRNRPGARARLTPGDGGLEPLALAWRAVRGQVGQHRRRGTHEGEGMGGSRCGV